MITYTRGSGDLSSRVYALFSFCHRLEHAELEIVKASGHDLFMQYPMQLQRHCLMHHRLQ